jgi:C1A family cysteine protease
MKFLIVAASATLALGSNTIEHRYSRHFELDNYTFDDYLKESGKKYTKDEYELRKQIFSENMNKIIKHNAGKASWKMGVNKFTDMSSDELKSTLGGNSRMLHSNKKETVSSFSKDLKRKVTLPSAVDWRNTPNVISPVKDQGHCGSCKCI